jgi:hypothetical protein
MPNLKKQSKLIHRRLELAPADIELCVNALLFEASRESIVLASALVHKGSRPVTKHPTKSAVHHE